MSHFTNRATKIQERINELAAITEVPGQVTRTFGTPAFIAGSQLVQSWMQAAGLETRVDNIGNVRGRKPGAGSNLKTFVIASHIDTVVNAGKWDGPLGVLLGLDLLETLGEMPLPFDLELIAFSDEEGVRFHTTYLGSKVVAGTFDPALLAKEDAAGTTLNQVIQTMGGDPNKLPGDAIASADWLGYLEVHIEQGPVLYEQNIPVGLVTGIAGQRRVELTFRGMAGHAGTVPMTMRRDALAAAAEFVLATESFGQEHTTNLVATVGKLQVTDAASNVIPGEVTCTLDLRSSDEAFLNQAYTALQAQAQSLAQYRHLDLVWQLVQETKPVRCDPDLNQILAGAIAPFGYPVLQLVSGAGHDAVPVSEVAPVAMLLVRCYRGISHNPLENVALSDLAAAIRVSYLFLQELIHKKA